jgi:hypothetical protein
MPRDGESLAQLTDSAIRSEVSSNARCAAGPLDPDEWFPVSLDPETARREAAGAIAVCMSCPVRGACLELSLRHWFIGQHGVWGGLVPAERAALRRQQPASVRNGVRALPILDHVSDGPQATSHAGRRGRPATAAVALQAPRYAFGQVAPGIAAAGREGDHCERGTRPLA